MKEFLVVMKNFSIEEHFEDIPCIVSAKNKNKAKEKFRANIKDWYKSEYNYIKNSIIGKEESPIILYGCNVCEWADSTMGTCPHQCVQEDSWWEEIIYKYCDNNKNLSEILKSCIFDKDYSDIEKIIDFVIEKKSPIKYLSFIDIDSFPKYK